MKNPDSRKATCKTLKCLQWVLLMLCGCVLNGCTTTLIATGAVVKTVVMAPIRLGEAVVEAITDDDSDKGETKKSGDNK